MRWKIQKCKKVRFVDYFVVLVAILFKKLHLSPQTTLLDNQIIRCWSYSTFWSTKSLEIRQKLVKVKNSYILKFSSFLVANCAFFSVENFVYFLTKASQTTILFLVERLLFSKQNLEKYTKLNKNFKNLNFLVFLTILVRIWCIFPAQIAFTSSKKPPGQRIVWLLNVCRILSH